MLVSPDTLKPVSSIPHKKEFDLWKSRLTKDEYESVIEALTEKLSGDQIVTSSFIPGSDWTGTPYYVLYEKACLGDEKNAAFFFGLIMWDAVMRHPETWCFGKYPDALGVQGADNELEGYIRGER